MTPARCLHRKRFPSGEASRLGWGKPYASPAGARRQQPLELTVEVGRPAVLDRPPRGDRHPERERDDVLEVEHGDVGAEGEADQGTPDAARDVEDPGAPGPVPAPR